MNETTTAHAPPLSLLLFWWRALIVPRIQGNRKGKGMQSKVSLILKTQTVRVPLKSGICLLQFQLSWAIELFQQIDPIMRKLGNVIVNNATPQWQAAPECMLQLFPSKLLHIERGSRLIGFSARVAAIKAICSAYLMCGRLVGHTQRSHLVSAVQILLGFPFDRQMNAEPCHTMWQPRRETCNNQH